MLERAFQSGVCAGGAARRRGEASLRKAPLSVPGIRHLLVAALNSGWCSLEYLLRWSDWRRRHPFLAHLFRYRKQQLLLCTAQLQL